MKNRDTKLAQLEHSQAKVDLYTRYLSIYLNVLHHAQYISHVLIFDLLCGEGKYPNGCLGSSIGAASTIRKHYLENNNTCIDIDFFLNDAGYSEFEIGKSKIQRNRDLLAEIEMPPNVNLHFAESDYSHILPATVKRLDALTPKERALVFVDPYGYKDINASDLASLLRNGKTELLLFLPASFIYRFAESAFSKDFRGAEALRMLLSSVFPTGLPQFSSCEDFISKLLHSLRQIVQTEFASSFLIQRDEANKFCLLFYTNNERGFEKMLEAKWALDGERGQGYRPTTDQLSMFDAATERNFEDDLFDFISQAPKRSNAEMKLFGLKCEFLPKHTRTSLKQLQESGKIEVVDGDGQPARSFYLNDKNRVVYIRKKG